MFFSRYCLKLLLLTASLCPRQVFTAPHERRKLVGISIEFQSKVLNASNCPHTSFWGRFRPSHFCQDLASWDTGGTAILNTSAFSISRETPFQPYPQKASDFSSHCPMSVPFHNLQNAKLLMLGMLNAYGHGNTCPLLLYPWAWRSHGAAGRHETPNISSEYSLLNGFLSSAFEFRWRGFVAIALCCDYKNALGPLKALANNDVQCVHERDTQRSKYVVRSSFGSFHPRFDQGKETPHSHSAIL